MLPSGPAARRPCKGEEGIGTIVMLPSLGDTRPRASKLANQRFPSEPATMSCALVPSGRANSSTCPHALGCAGSPRPWSAISPLASVSGGSSAAC